MAGGADQRNQDTPEATAVRLSGELPLKVLDLFSGIGGFSLGLERTGGFETVAFCEIDPFARKVLAKHWPEVPCYDDVRTLTAARLAADGVAGIEVITGGFPCQDVSCAGRQAGLKEGTRSGLWSEILRLSCELRPRFVIVENVANLLSGPSEKRGGWFGRVLGDLAESGYDAEWHCIPASFVGLPQARERVWIIAYADGGGRQECSQRHRSRPVLSLRADDDRLALAQRRARAAALRKCRVADGSPNGVDRVGACGNAVVPQIPELIGRAILAARAAA